MSVMSEAKKSKLAKNVDEEPVAGEGTLGDSAISSGVIFYERLPDGTQCKCPRGQIFLGSDHARPIRRLVLHAARHLGWQVPSMSAFDRAELFYRNDALVEMRVDGKYVERMNEGGGIEIGYWSTPEAPEFTYSGGHSIRMNPADEAKSYVAVINRSIGIVVNWDLSSQYALDELTEADAAGSRFIFPLSEWVNQNGPGGSSPKVVSASAIKEERRWLSAKYFLKTLLPEPRLGSNELLMVDAGDKHRLSIYVVDKAEIKSELIMTGLVPAVPVRAIKVDDVKSKEYTPHRIFYRRRKSRGIPDRGRPARTNKEYEGVRANREQEIKRAVMILCAEAKKSRKNVLAVEDILTPAAVAKELGKHLSTLYRWLDRYNLDFDDIVNECLRRKVFAPK
jgi:hypothetical protein